MGEYQFFLICALRTIKNKGEKYMIRTICVAIFGLVSLFGSTFAQSASSHDDIRVAPAASSGASLAGCRDSLLSPAASRQDIDILQTALEEAHPGVHRYTSKAELDRLFDNARRSANRPLCALDLYRMLAPVVGALKCGHTSLLPPDETVKRLNNTLPVFPFAVRVLDSEIYLISDYSGDDVRLRGARLLSVNGHTASELLATLLSAVGGDGDSQTAGRWRLAEQFLFSRRLYTMVGIEGPFQISFELNGKKGETTLEGVTFPRLQEMAQRERIPPNAPRIAEYHAIDQDTAFLRLARFADEIDGKPTAAFLDDVFKDLVASRKKSLIVDLRDNGGGADELGAQLLAHFANRPFQYYRDLVVNKLTFDFYRYSPDARPLPSDWLEKQADGTYRLVKHPNWGQQRPTEPIFQGKVIILANGGSFSTTCEFLAKMQDSGRAIIIGEESGGAFSGNTSGPAPTLILPNSKLQLPIHLLGYYMAVGNQHDPRRGVLPDIPVHYSIDDVLKGTDLEMAAALRLVRKEP
jgi:hypothetical protein